MEYEDENANDADGNKSKKFFEIRTKTSTTTIVKQNIYIHMGIEKCELLPILLNTFRNANPNDELSVYLNCSGGCLYTTFSILNAMDDCAAPIRTIMDGQVASAATFIFLNGDIREARDNSTFMAHNFSSSLKGKGHEILEQTLFHKDHFEKFFRKYYEGFFSEEEIKNILQGKDYFLNKDGVDKRLKKMETSENKPKPKSKSKKN
jgi:ATP-dependent protease ClpP protease subunit